MKSPDWLLHELQLKGVLFLNHVLQASVEALPRTRRLAGRTVQLRWQSHAFQWMFTPAGLLEAVAVQPNVDLTLSLGELSPWELADHLLRGEKPALRIEGDVQMAAEINWLVDHVRWDAQEDLARVLGDTPAQALVVLGRRLAQGVRQFVQSSTSRRGATS